MSLKNIGKAFGTVGKIGVGLATGGIGGAVGTAITAFGSRGGGAPPQRRAGPGGFDFSNPVRMLETMGVVPHRGRVAPVNGQCPRGWHLNKAKLSDGTPARSMCVRNRSMEPLNGRAAARAIKRIKRAEKLVRKLRIFSGTRAIAARSGGGHKAGCGCVACKRR